MRIIGGLLISVALTTSAMAQPALQSQQLGRPEGMVGVGLTIPFGGQRQKEPPRVELRLSRDMVNVDGSRQSNLGFRPMETRIGIALEPEHRLMLNGRPMDKKQRNNISTLGWIAIGVGATLVVGVVLVADAARDASE